MSRCPDIDEQMSQKSDEQMSDEQVLHNRKLEGQNINQKYGEKKQKYELSSKREEQQKFHNQAIAGERGDVVNILDWLELIFAINY